MLHIPIPLWSPADIRQAKAIARRRLVARRSLADAWFEDLMAAWRQRDQPRFHALTEYFHLSPWSKS